ncbi:MAG: hypothetical protein L3J63_01935 [Geopsychrobacter sp.]|nr:hypothetical protein [Geopsychrobacter sp.]
MNVDNLFNFALNFFHQYPIPVALGALVLCFIVIKSLKASFKLAILLLVLAAFFYAISLFSGVLSTGTKNADQMIQKSRNVID